MFPGIIGRRETHLFVLDFAIYVKHSYTDRDTTNESACMGYCNITKIKYKHDYNVNDEHN